MLVSGEGTTSGDSDQGHLDVAWEIAPLRKAALRTERAVNRRWETLRAAIIGGAALLGVIGAAAALSLSTGSFTANGMGFLSASASSSAEAEVTADEARDGVAGQGAPTPPSDPAPPASDEGNLEGASAPSAGAPPVPQPEPSRGSPTAEPQPEPSTEPDPEPLPPIEPTPDPSPSEPAAGADGEGEEDGGLLGDLLDILLPGLLP